MSTVTLSNLSGMALRVIANRLRVLRLEWRLASGKRDIALCERIIANEREVIRKRQTEQATIISELASLTCER